MKKHEKTLAALFKDHDEKMLAALFKDHDGETAEFSDDLIEAIGAVCKLNVKISRAISDGTKTDALMYLKCIYDEAINLIEQED